MEHSFIAWLRQRVSHLPKVKLGIGDDAALLDTKSGIVVTTDSLCDGTHFILSECGARAVGRKVAAVNLSDLAAMNAEPTSLFLSLCLPRASASEVAVEIVEGVLEHCERFSVPLAGGDTNVWDGPLVVHMTAIGEPSEQGCWTRSGAKVGDAIVVSGTLGGSLLGKHLHFEPRLSLAKSIRSLVTVHAATDISDGLGVDLLNIVTESRCGARLELDKIPISDAAKLRSQATGQSPLDHAFGDGEDFELLMAMDPSEASKLPAEIDGVPLTVIGEIVSRTGLWTREGTGWKQVSAKGYIHR